MNCNVIERILKAWKDNDEQQKANGLRQGYMGHLINIINKIVELCSSTSLGKFFIDNMPEVAKSLDEFKDSTLKEANTLQDTLLVNNNESFYLISFNNLLYRVVHILILPMKKMTIIVMQFLRNR